MDDRQKSIQDYLRVFYRRRWQFLLPALAVCLVAVLAAVFLPPVYRSTATVLIEEPDVPRELVQSTVTSYADQRLQVITQRVLTTRNLIDIVEKYSLYQEARRKDPIHKIIEDFREKINMDLVSADVVDPRSGRTTQATIAFMLSFDHGNARTAQQIVNELVSLYLGENLRERRKKAAETTEFLGDEVDRLARLVTSLETRLADFKKVNSGKLPEQLELNRRQLERSERDATELDRRLQALEERRIYLESEVTQVSRYGSYRVDGENILSPPDMLKMLRTQFIGLNGTYGPDHPDVKKLKREIAALERETGAVTPKADVERELSRLTTELSLARKKYGPEHPDVQRLVRQIETLESAQGELEPAPRNGASDPPPDNPAYIQLQAQLQSVKSEMKSLQDRRTNIENAVAKLDRRILETPEVERDYLLLRRDYENAHAKYQEVKNKQLEAELAEALESERKSERFSLIEPPLAPLDPIKPNRILIVILGFVLGGTVGLGLVLLLDAADEGVYGAQQVAEVTGALPLVVVPYMETAEEARRKRLRRIAAVGFSGLAGAAGLLLVHLYVAPLDVMWFGALRRFGWS